MLRHRSATERCLEAQIWGSSACAKCAISAGMGSPQAGQHGIGTWFALGLFAHLAAAWLSLGPHHVDEHFQVLEFLSEKLGATPPAEMPWEFASRLRSWIEVGFLYNLARLDHVVGIGNPLAVERSFRLVFATLGWLSGILLCDLVQPLFHEKRLWRWLVIAQGLYWPIVYVHARISSEAVGGTLLLFGLWFALAPGPHPIWSLLAGFVFGLAFGVRVQLVFGLAGFLLFAIWIERWKLQRVAAALAGFAIALGVGVACDYWGYGELTFTPWNYVRVNLLEGRAASFGVEPVWWYWPQIALWLLPPFSLLVVVGAFWFWFARRRHALTWITLPLVLGHMAIGHKEFRFLFPLTPFAPLFALLLLERMLQSERRLVTQLARYGLPAYAAVGALMLVPMTWRPPKLQMRYMEYVQEHAERPFRPAWMTAAPMQFSDLPVYYYRPRGYEARRVTSFDELRTLSVREPVSFFWDDVRLPPAAGDLTRRCQRVFTSVPEFALSLGLDRVLEPEAKQGLFRCSRANDVAMR